jgi:hypothetical protein
MRWRWKQPLAPRKYYPFLNKHTRKMLALAMQ